MRTFFPQKFIKIFIKPPLVRRKLPLTNLAAHPVLINFWILTNHEFEIFEETGEFPVAFGDENYPSENSPFQEYIHAFGLPPKEKFEILKYFNENNMSCEIINSPKF